VQFIEDKELQNLYQDDLLETKKYANTLQHILEKSKTSLTIGIFGEWGSGKSSIINTVKNNVDKKIKFVIYDAWKYHSDSFRRMFLRELANQLNIKMQDNFESFYIDKNETVQINKRINLPFFITSMAIIIFAFICLFILPKNIEVEWKIGIPLLISIVGIAVGISKNLFDSYNVNINKIKLFAPEQFEEIYNYIIEHIFNPQSNWEKFKKWIKEKFQGNLEKIVIVIDNLDRCDDNAIYELLTTIKTFLQKDNVVFIIPIDDLRLKKFLLKNHKLNEKEVDEFLRKIFDVTLKIKQFKPLDMFHYTNELNNRYKLNLQPDTIDIFAKEYATNPRRIIQLINNLLVEKDILKNKYNEEFSKKYESVIAKLLIIREEWPDFYKKLQEDSRLLNNIDNEDNNETNENEELKKFLKRTRGYSANLDIEIIRKIISNIDNSFGIDNGLIGKLENFDYEGIENNQYIDNGTLNYIFEELSKELKNQTFKGGALNKFKNLIHLNLIEELPSNFVNRFNSDFEIDDILKIIDSLDNYDSDDLFSFINILNKNYFDDLLNKIISKYKDIWKEGYQSDEIKKLPKIWNDGLNYLINNLDDKEKIKQLQEPFIHFYDYYSKSSLYKEKWIDDDKLKIIISQEFIDYLIDKVDENFENDSFKELLYFSELNLLTIQQVEKIFEKLDWTQKNNFSSQQEAKEKCITDLLTKINNINSLIESLEPIEYKSKILEAKLQRIQSISKEYNHRYPIGINLLNDIGSNKESQKNLLNFYFYIYKDTYNETNILNYIVNLVNKYKNLETLLYIELLNLNKKYNFKLESFLDYLLLKNNINKDLLKIYLIYIQEREILEKHQKDLKNKIVQLLNQYEYDIKWFFDEISQKNIFKDALIEVLTEKFEIFDNLPIAYRKIVFDYICENNLVEKYENNIEVLKELAKEKYEKCIENILVKKLGEQKIDEVLEVLGSLEIISATLWKSLGLLERYKEQEKWKEKILDIEQKINK